MSQAIAELDVSTFWPAIEGAADQLGLGIFVAQLGDSPRVLHVSARAVQMIGRPASEIVGGPPWAMLRRADWPRIHEMIASRPPGAPPTFLATAIALPDGTERPIDVGIARIATRNRELSFGYFRDVTAEKRMIEALRESERRFRSLVDAAPDGVTILVAGNIVYMNARSAQLLGADPAEAIGQPLSRYQTPEDARRAAERIATMFRTGEEMPPSEYGVLHDPDRVVEIKSIRCEWGGKPAVLAFGRDVTERKALEKQLALADRLAALGTLAAGIAHEINNPLTYAQLSVQRIERLLVGRLPDELAATVRGHLEDVQTGIVRVAAITSSLRTFARADDAPPGPTDLVATLERALKMVDNDLRHRAQLEREFRDAPTVIANASRLEQVFVNVLINAIQATPPDDVSNQRIAISIDETDDAVAIAIRDTGLGVPSAARERVFDPFFTTKPLGEGTGLGLALAKSIVESFGGSIALASREGAGTTVTVTLQRYASNAASEPPIAIPAEAVRPRRRVMVVDDDGLVRRALAQVLAPHHDVTAVDGAEAALAALGTARFDAVLCDMMMPHMNGRELHRRIATEHAGAERRVIFMSGGTFVPHLDRFLIEAGNRCLSKPFDLAQALEAIEAVCARA